MDNVASQPGAGALAGRCALVTGSTAGIGRAIAEELARQGAAVAINGRSEERARSAAEAIASATGARTVALAADLTDADAIDALIDATVRELGAIDVLVNNAGMGMIGDSESLPLEDWQRAIDLDLTAPFLCAQAAARHMLPAGRGVVINVSSITGHVALPRRAAYCAAKHGLIGLTKVLGVEWAARGVRCVSVDPGYVGTEFVRESMARDGFDAAVLERRTPAGRLGTPEDVAGVVAFLASDAAAYVTGSSVLVDGGWVAYGGW